MDMLKDDPQRTLCPYQSARLAGYVSFDLKQLEVTVDGAPLLAADHQQVVAHGSDRSLVGA